MWLVKKVGGVRVMNVGVVRVMKVGVVRVMNMHNTVYGDVH